ncbi:TPA: hypothetical protein I8Y16_005173 [Raoultella ornithinolytica]|nr:hypothetical protein [Raoultella ornithinolytica]HAT1671260.1 hypothetical protein [Raoultella ornithinolytica]
MLEQVNAAGLNRSLFRTGSSPNNVLCEGNFGRLKPKCIASNTVWHKNVPGIRSWLGNLIDLYWVS